MMMMILRATSNVDPLLLKFDLATVQPGHRQQRSFVAMVHSVAVLGKKAKKSTF